MKKRTAKLQINRLTLRKLDAIRAGGDPWDSMLCVDTKDTVNDETCNGC